MPPFDTLPAWPVDASAAVVRHEHDPLRHGDTAAPFALASVTKLLTALAALVAHEEGTLPLDEEITAAGASAADLLAHAAGVAPDEPAQMSPPRTRRIYSTAAYEIVAQHITERSGMSFGDYLTEAVVLPLGLLATTLEGSAGAGATSTVDDLLRVANAWVTPLLVDQTTLDRATRPHMGELAGVLPGFGRQDPNPWGLGPEIRGTKQPHWTAPENSPETFGHFGQSGTMLWIDPVAGVTAIALTAKPFGDWAATAWPRFSCDALTV